MLQSEGTASLKTEGAKEHRASKEPNRESLAWAGVSLKAKSGKKQSLGGKQWVAQGGVLCAMFRTVRFSQRSH